MKIQNKFRIVALVLVMAFVGHAQTRGIGIGAYVQAGNANELGGLNAKLFLDARSAVDLSLSVQMSPLGQSMGAYASYLIHGWDIIPVAAGKLPLYGGPSAGVGVWDGGTAIRVGGVGGIAYCMPPSTVPMDFFLQLNPKLEYHTDSKGLKMGLLAQLGLRFFFG